MSNRRLARPSYPRPAAAARQRAEQQGTPAGPFGLRKINLQTGKKHDQQLADFSEEGQDRHALFCRCAGRRDQ